MPSAFGNFFIKTLIRSPFHALMGENFAVITVTGRKTGKLITTPVNTLLVDGHLTIISKTERTWWRNLRGKATASLHRAGKQVLMHADVMETPDQVFQGLKQYFSAYPGHVKYYGINCNPTEQPDPQDLKKLARERVIIRLLPE